MKIKAQLLLSMLVLLSMTLDACKGSSSTSNSTGTSTDNSDTSLSEVNLLLVGTLKLEGTDQAVTVEEAAQLLTLWQAYRSLSSSQTAAEEEVNSLVKQIQSTMTTQQMDAIQAMNLTNTDMVNLMQSMGGMRPQGTPDPKATPEFDFPGGGFSSGNRPEGMQPPSGSSGGTRPNFPSGGDMPGGGAVIIQGGPGMGDDGGIGGSQMLQGTPNPTVRARFNTQASQVNTVLLNMLISKLETMTKK